MRRTFYVYILASDSRELYVGITNNLIRRIVEHREGTTPTRRVFRHPTTRLVHVEAAGRGEGCYSEGEAAQGLDETEEAGLDRGRQIRTGRIWPPIGPRAEFWPLRFAQGDSIPSPPPVTPRYHAPPCRESTP